MENQDCYIGECKECGKDNTFKMPIGEHLPEGVEPKYCSRCGKEMIYTKKEA